jgi:hypothetical protein
MRFVIIGLDLLFLIVQFLGYRVGYYTTYNVEQSYFKTPRFILKYASGAKWRQFSARGVSSQH